MAVVQARPARSPEPAKSPRDYLAEISTIAKAKPMAAVAYGVPGVGKTSLGAAVPGRVFLVDDKEDGINTLKANGLVDASIPVLPPASQWEDVQGSLQQLATGQHALKGIVIDTGGGMERLCHEYTCRTQFGGDWGEKGFAGYQRGYEVALPEWRLFLNALDSLRARGMYVLMLCHAIIRPFKNPDGEDFDRWIADMHHKTWTLTHRWADMVLFLNYYVEAAKERGSTRAKGRGGQQRIMYTEHHAAYDAKNRSSLPTEIDMGQSGDEAWANLKVELQKARKGGEA